MLVLLFCTLALGLRPEDCPEYVVVQDVKDISAQMKQEIVAGIKKMKTIPSAYEPEWNAYDYFAVIHARSLAPGTLNHGTWAFPFWHRVFLQRWNNELRRATNNPKLTFPYWDFTSQESLEAWLDDMDYIGGRGLRENGYVLQDGHLRAEAGFPIFANASTWPQASAQGAIVRAPGNGIQMCLDENNESYVLESIFNFPDQDTTLDPVGPFISLPEGQAPVMTDWMLTPDASNINCAWDDGNCLRTYTNLTLGVTMTCKHFAHRLPNVADQEACTNPLLPYLLDDMTAIPTVSYRPCLEGQDYDDVYARGLERLGATLHPPHGSTHQWIGGSIAQPTAPSDPAFAHIHMNIDRLFREAQLMAAATTPPSWQFSQETLATKIDNFVNPEVTVGDYMDTVALGYVYDTDVCPSICVNSKEEPCVPAPSSASGNWVRKLLFGNSIDDCVCQ